MNLTKIILRGLLLLLTVLFFIYLNVKTNENIDLIAKFKFETLENIKTKSLDSERKFDILENKTTRFSGMILEDTINTGKGITYLSVIMGLLIALEIGFYFLEKEKL